MDTTLPYNFTDGTVADAEEVNLNNAALITGINANTDALVTKASKAGTNDFLGANDFTVGSCLVETRPTAESTTKAASTAFVQQEITANAGQAGSWHIDGSQIATAEAVTNSFEEIATGLSVAAICLFKVRNKTNGDRDVICKSPDDTGTTTDWNVGHLGIEGPNRGRIGLNEYCYLISPCNASGDVDFATEAAGASLDIWLVGYVQ
jgi:hypothetical protein